jgi:hypothetical protein
VLTCAPNLRIYLHARPTDMRKGFDGRCAPVRNVFRLPESGRQATLIGCNLPRPNGQGPRLPWNPQSTSIGSEKLDP